jgi:hypothetical protein
MGREELKRLMQSTYVTWYKVCNNHKIPTADWKMNGQYNYIEFTNGSRIDLLDLKYLPTDPLYERFGSLEYTGGWIEEAGEVNNLAFDVLKSRVGRQLNDKYDLLPPKIFITCNPKKNWLYYDVYKPSRDGKLNKDYCFVQALYGDNPYTAKDYGQSLSQITDKVNKKRLMFGDWEYDDDQNSLMSYESIIDLFTNPVIESENQKYLIADIARYGRDSTTVSVWYGLVWKKTYVWTKQGIDQTAEQIRKIMFDEQIPYSHCLIDDDGIGGGVVDILRGTKGFINNSSPIQSPITGKPENYQNLKTQCAYTLADYVKDHKIKIEMPDLELKQKLIDEIEQIKSKDIDNENKRKIIPKEEVKEIIGRSPDLSDNLLMRMYYELTGGRMSTTPNGVRIIRANLGTRLR